MKLKIIERILLSQCLPSEGNYLEMVFSESINNKIRLQNEEIKKYEIQEKESGLFWNSEGEKAETEIDFNEAEEELICNTLIKKDESKKLKRNEISLYKKFINKKND